MQTILKYTLDTTGPLTIPGFVHFLDLQVQYGKAVIWALTDSTYYSKIVTISSYLTGQEYNVNPKSQYLGTLQFDNGTFVRHYYAIYN